VTLDDDIELCAAEPVTLVTYFAPKPQFSVPQYVFAHQTATVSNEQRTVTLAAPLPACNTQADLFFGGEDDIIGEITEGGKRYGDTKLGSGTGPGSRSKGPQGWYNGGAKGCHQPAVQPVPQCDGAVDVNLSNTGEQTKYPVDFTVRAGEFTQTVTVAPGKGETVRVPAGRGPITVTADGMKDVTYEWQRPENCPPPGDGGGDPGDGNGDGGDGEGDGGGSGTGGGAGDDDGGLPVTGAAAGTIAAGAAVLLIGGGVLFVVARRRRVTFTP
jgi:LPXTG-motif cell wall-anchored protein